VQGRDARRTGYPARALAHRVAEGRRSTAAASRVFFYRWSGTAWTTPAPSPPDLAGTDARKPHLEVDTRGRWVVAWAELASTSTAVVRVARREP
jgi:hypothetical protein